MVDYIIKGGVIYTMNQERQIIKDGGIAVTGSDIIAVGEEKELINAYDVERVLDAEGMAVLPGFVNVHTHLPSIFVRGVYGVVREGLYQVLFPVKKFLEPEHCYTLGLASCLEALTSGCTTIQETYNYMDEFAKAAEVTGIRADLGEQVVEADYQSIKDGTYRYIPDQAEEMLKRAIELKQDWHGREEGRITVSWAPLAPDMCTPWVYEEIQRYQEAGEKISTHIAQYT
jgi:5-methylthioadenosine/S-adenosylhomocysteine deaminase